MLTALFGSRLRARLLAWLMTHHDEWYFVRQLTVILGEDSTNLSRELARLARMGLLVTRTEWRHKYYRANETSPIFPELRSIAVKTGGIADVLRNALAPLAGRMQMAFIYGSFAEGNEWAGSDVDLMIIGDVQLSELVKVLRPAQETLGREVNPVVFPAEEFRTKIEGENHFLLQVLSGEKLFLMGGEGELTRLAS